jgi:two-component system chemotaxis response regulator CheB
MPGPFTTSFAARLDRLCAPRVLEVTDGEVLKRGHIYLAPGNEQHLAIEGVSAPRGVLKTSGPVGGHRPAVDVLFQSLTRRAQSVVACLLTGMGCDGAAGMKALKEQGARTFVQDEETSAVFGMPRAALECGAATRSVPLERIAEYLLTDRQKSITS